MDALDRQDLGNLLKTDFCFAAGDGLADWIALDECSFGLDIRGDTEALKEADQIAAARTG